MEIWRPNYQTHQPAAYAAEMETIKEAMDPLRRIEYSEYLPHHFHVILRLADRLVQLLLNLEPKDVMWALEEREVPLTTDRVRVLVRVIDDLRRYIRQMAHPENPVHLLYMPDEVVMGMISMLERVQHRGMDPIDYGCCHSGVDGSGWHHGRDQQQQPPGSNI